MSKFSKVVVSYATTFSTSQTEQINRIIDLPHNWGIRLPCQLPEEALPSQQTALKFLRNPIIPTQKLGGCTQYALVQLELNSIVT